MKPVTLVSLLALAAGMSPLGDAALAQGRDQIRIVGSSTVYPFTTAVAEQFGKKTKFKSPVVESTGTGGGMKLFCDGVGVGFPDVTNASRRMKKGEFDNCAKNGVKDIVEINIGFDGLTMAHSKGAVPLALTLGQVFLALAKDVPGADGKLAANPNRTWADIDKSLPATKIEILGPPPTSGTRDSLHELFMEMGAEQIPVVAALRKSDPKAFERAWKSLREDGAYVEAGENDNVIVQKIEGNRNAYGIFGYSFLEENAAKLQGVTLDGVEPTFDNIAANKYKGARRMYVYLKKAHVGVIPGLEEFADEYVSKAAMGEEGYLAGKGLVTLPKAEYDAVQKAVTSLTPMPNADALTN